MIPHLTYIFVYNCILAPNIVLSAAHCVPTNVNGMLANINNFDLGRPGSDNQKAERIPISTIRVHSAHGLGASLSNDFALFKLSSPSSNPTVRLNTNANIPKLSDPELTVIGWGTTVQGVNSRPSVLQEVDVDYVSNNACKGAYGFNAVTNDMICCREAGQGACQGDSGGPLVLKGSDGSGDLQVGIVSWGYDCALEAYPGT